MNTIDRRSFLNDTAKTLVATTAASAITSGSRARASGPNNKIGLGLIGVGGRGNSHLTGFGGRDDCHVVAVCDVNRQTLAAAQQWVQDNRGHKPAAHEDMRRLFDDPQIEAVVIATPDHWHCLASVWACQAGKDVYVEKPVSNNPWEGRQLVKAARKYDRIVQVGTQNRSAPYNLKAKEYLDSGRLGEVTMVRVYNQKYFPPVQLGQDSAVPDFLNWDLWQGPAPGASL